MDLNFSLSMSDLDITWLGRPLFSADNTDENDLFAEYSGWSDTCISLDVFTAANVGDYSRVKALITSQPSLIKAVNKNRWNALMYAVFYNHEDITMLLLDKGASVHACNSNGQNAMMIAAKEGHHALVQHLLNCGSFIESRCCMDWTPLHYAAYFDYFEVAQVLLKYRANPNALVRQSGETVLMFAARNGSYKMVRLLLDTGAFVNFQCSFGKDALAYAIEGGHDDVVSLLTQRKSKDTLTLLDGQNSMAMSLSCHRKAYYNEPASGYSASSTYTLDLTSLLIQIGLPSFIPLFKEHEVDLLIFLNLSDKDLKECGVTQLGPRRRMLEAISRWHNNVPLQRGPESVYELKLLSEVHELQERVSEIKQSQVDLRRRLLECQRRSIGLRDQLGKVFQTIQSGYFPRASEMFAIVLNYVEELIQGTLCG